MPKAARSLVRSPARLAGVVAFLVLMIVSQTLHAQGASVLMFYGGTLKAPVLLTGEDAAAFNNVSTRASMTVADMGDRPYIPVALYWGSRTDPASNGTPLAALKPEMAWQHGRFYPAAAGKPAVLLTTELTKQMATNTHPFPVPSDGAAFIWGGPVSESALAVLKRVGVAR
jgi:hypothetical protein